MQAKYYYIYILTNYENTVIYIGMTNSLVQRVYQHKNKLIEGFTQRYKVHKLVYYEMYNDVRDAISREKQLKAGSRTRKLLLIQSNNPNFNDLYSEILK